MGQTFKSVLQSFLTAKVNGWKGIQPSAIVFFDIAIKALKLADKMQWKPIESAPKDGTLFDIWIKCEDCEFRGTDFCYEDNVLCHKHDPRDTVSSYYCNVSPIATYWIPQPPPPEK